MKRSTTFNLATILALVFLCFGCNIEAEEKEPYFEGEIVLSESRGLYGSLFKVHTTYTISEDFIKREQKLGGINSVFNAYAGVIVDLKKDSITLYYADKLSGKKNKHTTSIQNYKTNQQYKNYPNIIPSPLDNTFNLLPDYKLAKQVKDSTTIKEYKSDYALYKDEADILKQEVFDTKKIKIKRELLEIVFINIPKEINFLLKSDLRTTISDINNDSIVSGSQSKALDLFLRDVFQKSDQKTDLDKIARNRWTKLALNILKKGVDLNIHITTDVSELTSRKILPTEFSLPSLDFTEISDLDEFMNELPNQASGDFDD